MPARQMELTACRLGVDETPAAALVPCSTPMSGLVSPTTPQGGELCADADGEAPQRPDLLLRPLLLIEPLPHLAWCSRASGVRPRGSGSTARAPISARGSSYLLTNGGALSAAQPPSKDAMEIRPR
jgi:hypothetical protein